VKKIDTDGKRSLLRPVVDIGTVRRRDACWLVASYTLTITRDTEEDAHQIVTKIQLKRAKLKVDRWLLPAVIYAASRLNF
jgi:hypothetical protein